MLVLPVHIIEGESDAPPKIVLTFLLGIEGLMATYQDCACWSMEIRGYNSYLSTTTCGSTILRREDRAISISFGISFLG